MEIKSLARVSRALLFIAAICLFTGCEKREPIYKLKSGVGEKTSIHFDLMEDMPKYKRIRKTEWERIRALEERKKLREKARRMYAKESLWDY